MPPLLDEGEFTKLLRKSKREPINFTFGLGKSPENHVLAFHRRKEGKPLFMMLKKEAEGVIRGTWGTAESTAKTITLNIQKEIPAIFKNVKLFLKIKGLKLKPIIIDPEGNELEDEEGDDAALDKEANAALKRQLTTALKKLGPVVQKLLKATPDRKVELATPLADAKKALDQEDYDKARKAVLALGLALKGGATPAGKDAAGAKGDERRIMELWSATHDKVDAQIAQLQDILRKTGDDELRKIAEGYATVLEPYDKNLDTALESYYGAAVADKPKRRKAAAAAMNQCAKDIAGDLYLKQAEDNPFGVKVSIRVPFAKALTAMKKSIGS